MAKPPADAVGDRFGLRRLRVNHRNVVGSDRSVRLSDEAVAPASWRPGRAAYSPPAPNEPRTGANRTAGPSPRRPSPSCTSRPPHSPPSSLRRTLIGAAAGAVALLAAAGSAQAQVKEHAFKLATQTTAGTATFDASQKFAELVKQKSGGKMTVKVYGGGTLGKDVAVVSAMQGGTIDFCVMNTSLLAGVAKETGILDFPFVFANEKEAYAVLDGPFGKKLHEVLTPKGIVGLSYWEQGFRQIHTGKKPVTTADDIKGMKIRVIETPLYVEFMNALGANAVPLPYPELYTALEQKAIDGGTQPITNMINAKLLRGAEVPDDQQPHVQPAVDDRRQAGLGQAQRRREEDHPDRRRRGARLPAPAVGQAQHRRPDRAEEDDDRQRAARSRAHEDEGAHQGRGREVHQDRRRAAGAGDVRRTRQGTGEEVRPRHAGPLPRRRSAGVTMQSGPAVSKRPAPTFLRLTCLHAFKLATQTTAGTATFDATQKFAELVKQKSGGKMTVKVYGGGTLGKDVAVVSAMQGGTIDFCVMNTSLLAGVAKETGILDFPFVFANEKEAWTVLDGPFGKKLHDVLTPKGIVGLSYWEQGFRQIHTGKKPVSTADDIKGMKIRVIETPLYVEFMNALGANAVPLPYPELYTALEQKAIDGGTQPITNMINAKLFEVQKFLTISNHMYSPQSMIVGKPAWDKLTADEKKIIQTAADEARDFQRQLSVKLNTEGLTELKKTMTVNVLPEAERTKMKERTKGVVEKYTKIVGEPLVKEMYAELDKARAKK